MCGIIISPDKSKLNSIKHRGIQFTAKQRKILGKTWYYGHHRLPIQTLEEDNWTQPIDCEDGEFFLFNGEIFNYDKERYENDVEYLKDFFSNKDNGDESFFINEMNKWDGFWSIVLVSPDPKIGTLVFTDPLGKKQLYYNINTHEISSEIKELTNTKEIDEIFISCVNKWGYNTDDRTIYSDVKRIMPNQIYQFLPQLDHPIIAVRDYFDWNKNIPEDKSIYELLDESVKNRLISKKYKVSSLFSGGLDSTIILYFLRKYGANVDVYSIDNAEDGEYIRMMEDYWDLDLKFLDVDANKVSLEDRMKIYDINDSMIDLGSVIPQYYLFKDIKNKIVLTGDGADELFGGYRRISQYDSQKSDVFEELPFYHLVRIDRMSMNFTIECRNPFLSHDLIRKALSLPFEERTHKKILKDEFRGKIPDFIIDRKKNPLKIKSIRENEFEYRSNIIKDYISHLKTSK
jgi:asparagine synthase (glutamine-hydrolysing)